MNTYAQLDAFLGKRASRNVPYDTVQAERAKKGQK